MKISRVPGSGVPDLAARTVQLEAGLLSAPARIDKIFQQAWAITLSTFTCSESIEFHYKATRDDEAKSIESVVEADIDTNAEIGELTLRASLLDADTKQLAKNEFSVVHRQLRLTVSDENGPALSQPDESLDAEEQKPWQLDHLGTKETPLKKDLRLRFVCSQTSKECVLEFGVPGALSMHILSMLRTFEHLVNELCIRPEATVKDLSLCSGHDQTQLAIWNFEECRNGNEQKSLIDLIAHFALSKPSSTAVDAWDGKLSYAELDDLSLKLAGHLARIGFGKQHEKPNYIPILIEKSYKTVVAMIAAMKIGCPFVLLDSSQPPSRIQAIFADLKSSILICSSMTSELAMTMTSNIVCLEDDLRNASWWRKHSTAAIIPGQIADHVLYVVFTSGSTGKPKGIIIERDAFFSCARAYVQKVGLNKDTRTLQFASYAFDVSISDTLNSLLVGGCLCIPSDSERSERLAEAIRRLNPTWADLTPSLLRHFSTEDLHTITTVVVSGEALPRDVVGSWNGRIRLINVYGPAECSVQSTMRMNVSEDTASNIGLAILGTTWVVAPDNHDKLRPIGAIGELLIEGPHLARGYLNDTAKTISSFIEAPEWFKDLKQFDNGNEDHSQRLYCTGDLVQYQEDGSLKYIGRKDTQVKIRGQRVELEEIEHHVRDNLSPGYDIAVEMVPLGQGEAKSTTLVAFISHETLHDAESSYMPILETPSAAIAELLPSILDSLHRSLPEYMIPKFFLPISHMPLTASGKVDRRRLREAAAQLSGDDLKFYSDNDSDGKSTQSTMSFDLCESIGNAFATVLNISTGSVGDNDDFFVLGGDSITAMRVVSLCRQENIILETGDILQYRTVSKIASAARVNLPSSASFVSSGSEITWKDENDVPFGLSPIQRMFFYDSPNGDNHFNQSMLLEATRTIDVSQLKIATYAIVDRHPMLRSRFSRSFDGNWTQQVTENIESSFTCSESFIHDISDVTGAMNKRQNSFDIENGPVFSIDLIRLRGKTHPLLFINAHHAVIDLVSYRIILEDLEEHLNTGELRKSYAATSFHQWCQLEDEYASRTLTPDVVLPKPLRISNTFLDQYWSLKNFPNTYGNAKTTPLAINTATTKAILSTANTAFGTEPVELLNAALLHSFMEIFGNREPPTIFNEGHGREPWSSDIDVSRTVGWFTTIWPIQVDLEHYAGNRIDDLVRRVKDSRRQVPGNGLPYFASRYLNSEGKEVFGNQKMEIVFNFHGKFQQLEREGALFQKVMWDFEATADYGPDTVLPGIFEITCVVLNDCLKFEFIYGKHLAHQELILQWVTACAHSLDGIASRFSSGIPEGPTLVDLPQMKWGYSNIAHLEANMSDLGYSLASIEDVFPCLPMQEGILLSRARKSNLYRTGSILEFKSKGPEIDVIALCEAWKRVVERHSVLRTIFIADSSEAHHSYYSVVLKPGIQEAALSTVAYQAFGDQAVERASILNMLQKSRSSRPSLSHVPYRVKLVASRNPKSIFCDIEFNHAIMDGWSSTVLVQDWLNFYQPSFHLQEAMKYSSYVSHVLCGSSSLDYWRAYLERVENCLFPNLSGEENANETDIYNVKVELSQSEEDLSAFLKHYGTTLSSLFHVAWAILLRNYVGRDEVCFGYLTSGRAAPISGIEQAIGLFANLLPFRANVSGDKTIVSLLQDAQLDLARSLSHEHTSFMDIQACSNLKGEALFNTVVSIQYQKSPLCKLETTDEAQLTLNELEQSDPTEYDLALNVYLNGAASTAYISCWPSVIPQWKAQHLSGMFNGIIEQIIGSPQNPAKDIVSLQSNYHGFLRQFDSTMPVAIDECVHSLIYKQACYDPMATAISAWDRQLSYSDLDRESSKIAKLINGMGYGVGDWIPLLLQRSSWVPVAMLGVMKSGAAFVFLEATQPSTRLRQICADTNSTTILTTATLREKAKTILDTVVSVDEEDCYSSLTTVITSNTFSTPSDALYAIFTSGSTGAPKGVVIEHGAFASSALSHAPVANYTSKSRVLQFSSYAFDACMVEVMTTLIVGGCVCIPSEHDRWNDLPGAVARFDANLLFLTPSMLRGLEPSLFPSLKTILVGGEALSARDFQRWLGSARVVQMYGPSECSAYSAATEPLHSLSDVRNIGNMAGARPWIVNPENAGILSPIGAVGELLLEGPIVGRGYLNRPEQTAAAFIDPPNWRNSFPSGSKRKFYRTGDLVQYAKDGTIRILGRKDSQVKLRGQRIELGEIEHSLRDILPGYQHVCVELITLEDDNQSAMIVALVGKENKEACEGKRLDSSGAESTEMLRAIPDKLQIDIEDAKLRLSERLPHYMNPSLFLDIKQLPFTAGGKADRRRLRTEAARLASQYLLERKQQIGKARNRSFLTPWEKQLLEMVGSVLSRAPDELTIHDNFFRVGGDSLRAMKLAQLARSKDIPLSVQAIFQSPKLSSLAKQFHHHRADDSRREQATCPLVPPFSLLEPHSKDSIIQEISTELSIEKERIEDIYPCTPLQEGMISLTLANPDAYIMQRAHTLSSSCDLQKLKSAWNSCINFNPILRTRIVQVETCGSLQVVLSGEQEWLFGDNLETYLSLDRGKPMGLKEPLLRIALISEDTCQPYPGGKKHHVVVTMHHALYDGWSEGLIVDQVEGAYAGNSLTLRQFAPFVKHIEATKNDAEIFWCNETRTLDTSPMSFPPIHAPDYRPVPNTILSCAMELTNEHKYSQATVSTQIRLAWAMSLRHFMASDTVVFGVIANGRNAPMPGIEAVTGPTIATLPFKVQLTASNPIEDTLSDIQNKSTRMIPFEHFGLQNIRLLSASAAEECRFQSLLVVQPKPDQNYSDVSFLMDVNDDTTAFDTYPLTLQCSIGEAHVEVQAIYDTTIISEAMMQHVLDHFTHKFGQISEHPTRSVDQIESLSHSAKAQLTKWYDSLQDSQLSSYPSVCELVEKQCALRPESPAISAWDGEFSYLRLEKLSSAFAAHLVQLGIRIGSIVPICYEKSKWLAVILLGVIKTGAAFVLLDAFSHPIHRMQLIVDEVKGEVIITSKQLLATAEQLLEGQAVVISEDSSFFLQEPESLMKELPQVEGCTALYAIFTSGSTGRPKGVVIEHGGYVAGALSRQKVTRLDCGARVLQFSSCSFDTFITDIFDTLVAGACICMPSETERSAGLSHFARGMSVTYADLVPSVARLLRPDEVPTIKTLALSGEPMTTSDVTRWADKVRLCNLYGPAECSAVATAHVVSASQLNSANIGRVCGGISWVVSPTNHDVLLPIGAVGELVLEGPIVGRGYLGKVDERASSNFLQHLPKWRSMFPPAKSACRMYKTGDLVQYQMDGTLLFVGRKDSQVKLHGQRIELGDVEQHLRQAFSKSLDAVAIIVSRGSSSDHLAAFIVMPNDKNLHNSSGAPDSTSPASSLEDVQMAVNEEVRSDIHAAEALLRSLLPSFMVPTLHFPIHQLPRTPSGKVDRAKLIYIASELMSGENLETFTARTQIRAPSTDAEEALRAIWALALAVGPSVIGVDDGFLKLGGDSIMAMKVASLAASRGLKLSIPKLFQNASLESLAADAQSKDTVQPIDWALETALPLSLQDSVGSKPHAGIKPPAATYMGDILLTGATGRLARELLKQLIASPSVDKVHCVAVRQPGKCLTHEKIIIYRGDLSLPRLGMSEEEEASVLENSNAVIHCGARVSFVQDYETMRQVNVGSTKYLASMALKRQIPFHFISTVGVGQKHGDCNAAIEEVSAARHAPPCDVHDGYTATKWASEVFLEKMHSQFSLPVTIHRPSNIICDGDPEADIVNNLIVYSRRLGMVPHLSGWEGSFDFVSSATAATDIIGSVASGIQLPERGNSSGQSGVQYIHESGETVFPVNDLATYLGHTETEPLQTVSLRFWVNKALKAGMRNDVGKFLMDMEGSEEQIRMPRIKSRRVRIGQTLTARPVVTWAKLPAPAHRSV